MQREVTRWRADHLDNYFISSRIYFLTFVDFKINTFNTEKICME